MNDTAPGDAAHPTDHTTLTSILAGYAEAGFSGSFTVGEGSTVECHVCNTRANAARTRMSSLRRMEGASDPDDMFSVVAITCPNCGTQGTMILGFGPSASAEDSDVLHALQDFRGDTELAGNSAPGETVGDAPTRSATSR